MRSLKAYTRNESEWIQVGVSACSASLVSISGDSAKLVSSNHRQFCSNKSLTDLEQVAYDPKDGDLCLGRVKPRESMVEARSDSDVQIDRQT